MSSTAVVTRTAPVDIGIASEDRAVIVRLLNETLADTYVLYTKTQNYHWNVKGQLFQPLHALFQQQYEALAESTDEIAERVTVLGGQAAGTLREFVELSQLEEQPGVHLDARTMVANLLADHEAIIRTLRAGSEVAEQRGDMGTNDFLIGLMQQHEKTAWMLRAHLEDWA